MRTFIDYQNLWRYCGTYCWVSGELVPGSSGFATKSDRVLTTGLPLGAYDQAAYNPPPDLFLIFGATLLTEEDIKSFADNYGLLGLGERDGGVPLALEIAPGDATPATLPFQDECKARTLGSGELLSSWRREIRAMRDATNLWSALKQSIAGDSGSLARHVKWLGSDCVYYDSDPQVPLPPTSQILGIPPDGRANSFGQEADTGELRTLAVIASRAHNSQMAQMVSSR